MFYSEQIGDVTLAKIESSQDLRNLLRPYLEESEKVIIKPNFVDTLPGVYTSSESIRMLFEAIDQKIIVTEGHQLVRCLYAGEKGMEFKADGKTRDWEWLKTGGWGWLIRNPDWSWFRDEGHWDYIKKLDQKYLVDFGYSDLFKEFDVEWVNVTDEIWCGETVDPQLVKNVVEARYPSVQHERLYEYLPTKLYENRDAVFISYSKLKHYATFSMKNLFGMIPDPIRAWWHGKKNQYHQRSIIDITKIYSAFFNLVGVSEAIHQTPCYSKTGSYGEFEYRYELAENLNFAGVSNDLVQLDSVMYGMGCHNYKDSEHIDLAGGVLGKYDKSLIEKAENQVTNWIKRG